MNGYIVYVEGVRHEVHADTSLGARVLGKALYRGRKKYPRIDVHLVELAGEQVTEIITS